MFHNTISDLQDQNRFFSVSDRSCPKTDGLRPRHWSKGSGSGWVMDERFRPGFISAPCSNVEPPPARRLRKLLITLASGVGCRRSWSWRGTTGKTGRARTVVSGGSGGSSCVRLRVVLALLQWSKNRLQHVAHHLEARVDDEVDKTCTGVFYRTNVLGVSENISIARQRARHAQRDIATANRSSVCLSVTGLRWSR